MTTLSTTRWAYSLSLGLAIGVAMVAFAGTVGIAGAMSTQSWATAAILALVVGSTSLSAMAPLQARATAMNFIEKNLLVVSSSLLIIGTYGLFFQYLHRMRMKLSENADQLERLSAMVPASEPATVKMALLLSGILLLGALGTILLDVRNKKRGGGIGQAMPIATICCLLFSVGALTFVTGRSTYFLMQATATTVDAHPLPRGR